MMTICERKYFNITEKAPITYCSFKTLNNESTTFRIDSICWFKIYESAIQLSNYWTHRILLQPH